MAFTATNSQPFTDSSSTMDSKSNTINALPQLGHAGFSRNWGSMASNTTGTAGNIWASGSRTSGLVSIAATRDNSKSREVRSFAASRGETENIEGKTGSSSLVEHSVLDEKSYPYRQQRDHAPSRSLSAARESGATPVQTHNASILDFQSEASVGAAAEHNTIYGRQGATLNLSNQQRAPVALSPSTSAYQGYVSERQPIVYTKFDRPTGPPQTTDSARDSWSESITRLSPTNTRGPFSSQYGSRDHSQPTSSHSNDHFTLNSPEYSRATNRNTPNSSRAPSLSSQRNSVYSQYPPQLPETFVSEFGQMKVNGERSRPSTSYRSISSRDEYQNRGSGINANAPVFGAGAFGGKLMSGNVSVDTHGANRAVQQSPRDYSLGNGNIKYMHLREDTDRYSSSDRVHVASILDGPDTLNLFGEWQVSDATQSAFSRHKLGIQNTQGYIDPRQMQQMLIAQMRNEYAATLYNPYVMAGTHPLGVHPYMPFLPVPISVPATSNMPRAVTSSDGVGVQSALLYEFKSQTKSQRWELRDIHDHIAEFAGDQHGSRFIQTKLETANSDEKDRVFREIEPNAIQLMTDVFGNYVIQKFFENGDQTHKRTLAKKMQGQVLNLSLQMYGCRVVQKALDHVLVDQQAALITELEGNVIKCVRDQNGNHVIQKAIERCPPHTIAFIIAAFKNQVQSLSIHTYGCRVMQRCLEFCDSPSKAMILHELVDGIQNMICDQFGNYVVQHMVTKDDAAGRQRVLDVVIKGLEIYSKHKFASNVVEKCIEEANDGWRREVLCVLTSESNQRAEGESVLVGMLRDGYGNYVIQKLLDTLCMEDYVGFVEALYPAMALAKRTQSGKQLLSIEKKMYRHQQPFTGASLSANTHARPSPNQMPLPTPPYSGHGMHGSAANPTPSLASACKSFNHGTAPSGDGDLAEHFTSNSRHGSV